jgi:hypothetical protein
LKNYKKHTPKTIKAYLKKELKHTRKDKMLFYSYSPWKAFGFYYVGLLHKHSAIDTSYNKTISANNSTFFERKGVKKIDSFLLKEYMIPLEQENLTLYCFKKILKSPERDSFTLQENTYRELMTLKTGSNFIPYNKTTKDLADSVNIASFLPGYGAPLNKLIKLKNENKDTTYIGLLNQYLFFAYAAIDELDTIRQLLYEQRTFKGNNIKNRSSDYRTNQTLL